MGIIRVLHVTGKMNRGGAETFLMELYRHIDRDRIQFDFLEIQYDDEDGAFDDEIRTLGGLAYRFKLSKSKSPIAFFRRICRFFNDHREHQIIHSHQYTMSGYIVCAAKLCGKKTISHAHAIRKKGKICIHEFYNSLGIYLLKRYSDYYFGCSEDALLSLTGTRSDSRKAFIVKNAIDADKFYFSEFERNLQRNKYGITNQIVVGCVGRFSTVKNQRFLIKVFSEASKLNPLLLLLFVGAGEKENDCKELANELGIDNKCIFVGIKPDVCNIINIFDVFCLPSLSEGLGIVYIEAQCNGLPCIAPLETVPREADIGAGAMKRVSINAPINVWVNALLELASCPRINNKQIRKSISDSGYDIKNSIDWIENFYYSLFEGK